MGTKPKRAAAPRREPRQLCLICAIVDDLAAIAQAELEAGRFDDVGEALWQMRLQINGEEPGASEVWT